MNQIDNINITYFFQSSDRVHSVFTFNYNMGKQQSKTGFLKNWFQDPQNPDIYNQIRSGDQARKYLILISDLRQLKNYSLRIKQRNKHVIKIMYYHAIENNYYDIRGTYFNVYSENIFTVSNILQMRKRQPTHEQCNRNYPNQQDRNRIINQAKKRQEWIAKFSDIQTVRQIFQVYMQFLETYGAFRISENMIGVDARGQIKLWINENFAINYPSSSTSNQKIMLDDLIYVIQKIDLKRQVIPFIINQSEAQSQWQKLEDVIQFLQTRIKNQFSSAHQLKIDDKRHGTRKNRITEYREFGRSFAQNQVSSFNNRKQQRSNMPSQQRKVHPSFAAQAAGMRNALSNDKRNFQTTPKKHISYSSLYRPNHPNNQNAFISHLSYLSPRNKQTNYADQSLNKHHQTAKIFNSKESEKTHNYSLGQSAISAVKNSSELQRRGKRFKNFQEILHSPQKQFIFTRENTGRNELLSHNKSLTHGINNTHNLSTVTNTQKRYYNIENQKFYRNLKGQQPQNLSFNYNKKVRGSKSPKAADKLRTNQKCIDQYQKEKLAGSIQIVPSMAQSKKINMNCQRYSQQNSKKSSNIYPKDSDNRFILTKDVQDSMIFMKQWNPRGKTQNFTIAAQKKKPSLESKQVPGFISKRKNSSNDMQYKKEDVSEFQAQERRFTGGQIFQKSLLKRPSAQNQHTKKSTEFNRTLGINQNIKKQIPFYDKKHIEQKLIGSIKNGVREQNSAKYKYPYMKPIHPNVNNFKGNAVQKNVLPTKNQDYFAPIQIITPVPKRKQSPPKNQINGKKSPGKNYQSTKATNYVNIRQSEQVFDDNSLARSSQDQQGNKGYDRRANVLTQSDPVVGNFQEKNKETQIISKDAQMQRNKTSKFQFKQNQLNTVPKNVDQIKNVQDTQKDKKRKIKQEMAKMLSMEFGAVIGIAQNLEKSKNEPKHEINIKSPDRFNRTQQVSSAKNSPNKFQRQPNPSEKKFNEEQKNIKTKDQIIRQKVQKKKANFAQLKKQALEILSDDLF